MFGHYDQNLETAVFQLLDTEGPGADNVLASENYCGTTVVFWLYDLNLLLSTLSLLIDKMYKKTSERRWDG